MTKIFVLITFLLFCTFSEAQTASPKADVYLLTCGPGTETYSIYGHSALRVVIPERMSDKVYNWGVFDFSTSNFAWKFAKGKLDYMLDAMSYKGFLQEYFLEERYVMSQKINLSDEETAALLSLIEDNLRPENRKYKYDFFYDNCSTRIRDLLEKAAGNMLLYPPEDNAKDPSFRKMINMYHAPYPWLMFGTDLLLGVPVDREASLRDRMFLPLEMQKGLSESVINRENKMVPLLSNPEMVLDFRAPAVRKNLLMLPEVIFTAILVLVLIMTAMVRNRKVLNAADLLLFLTFSFLAVLMIFFNFFTDHQQCRWNLNIIWLNLVLFLCLITLIAGRAGVLWFRIIVYTTAGFMVLSFFLPQDFNLAIYPLMLILLVRSSARSELGWNPFSVK